jgi:hypothetical protein
VIWAMPFRPALPMNRANLRCLGLTVGIAIALAGCNRSLPIADTGNGEANPISYSTVAGYADRDYGEASTIARRALSDGFLTEAEYDRVIDAADAKREAEYRADKERAIDKWTAQ